MSERAEISIHEVLVAQELRRDPARWLTHAEIGKVLEGRVAARTIRLHTKRLVDLGLVDVMETFPGHRYRWSASAAQRNKSYLSRLDAVTAILNV